MDLNKKLSIEITSGTFIRFLVILAMIGFVYLIRDVVAILFFAILFILILQPLVGWLERYKIPRPAGVLMIYIILLSCFVGAITLLVNPISEQIAQLTSVFGDFWQKISQSFGLPTVQKDLQTLQSTLANLQNYFSSATQDIFSKVTGVIGAIVTFFIVLVVTFYGLVEESAFVRVVRTTVPMTYQPYLYSIANRIQRKLGMWVRGQLILAIIIFTLTFIGLSLLDVEYALVLALISGMLEFIPYFGPIFSGLMAFLLTVSVNPLKAGLVLILYVVIQQIENHVLVPKIMQKATGLNPIISVVSLLTGAKLGGLVGLILAIPVALTLSVFIQDFVDKKSEDQLRIQE